MKKILSLFLLLFFMFSTVSFTDEKISPEDRKIQLKLYKCLGVDVKNADEMEKSKSISFAMYLMELIEKKFEYMESHPKYKKAHMDCYKVIKMSHDGINRTFN